MRGIKLKKKKHDSRDERMVLTGMIVSTDFLNEVQSICDPDMLEARFAQTVARWCLEYWRAYSKAPGHNIEDIFHSRSRHELGEEETELIGDFLSGLSREYERADKFNVQYALDKAEGLFATRALDALANDLKSALASGDRATAENRVAEFRLVRRPSSGGVDPYTNQEAIYDAFEKSPKPLVTLPGAVGQLMNHFLTRDSLVGLMGMEKIGKTFLLYDIARRAARRNCNVAVFAAGDLSEDQSIRRFAVTLTGRNYMKQFSGKITEPIADCLHNQQNDCSKKQRPNIEGMGFEDPPNTKDEVIAAAPQGYIPCTFCSKFGRRGDYSFAPYYREVDTGEPLSWRQALAAGKKFMGKNRAFKLSTHANNTLSVAGIQAQLDLWETFEGFVPDVIVIDYADILTHDGRVADARHGENEKWKALRALSQTRHCLVVTATQSDAGAYGAQSLGLKNFSEDKRKYSHVSAMCSLNQTPREKRLGLMRIGVLLAREGDFDPEREAIVLRCLERGRAMIASYW